MCVYIYIIYIYTHTSTHTYQSLSLSLPDTPKNKQQSEASTGSNGDSFAKENSKGPVRTCQEAFHRIGEEEGLKWSSNGLDSDDQESLGREDPRS